MKVKHIVSIRDLSGADVVEIFDLAATIKQSPERYRNALRGKNIGMAFQKPSIRTRLSFEVAVSELGAFGVHVAEDELALGREEPLADTARTLSCYLDAIVLRAEVHADVVDLTRHAAVPVINGGSDLLHPCQALADYFTLREKKNELRGRKIAYVGDGGNICHSLLFGANKVGMDVAVATPEGHEPKPIIVKSALREASQSGVHVSVLGDPMAAVEGADAVYTDRWVTAENESERNRLFRPYQVNRALMARAKPDAVFMHRLPAQRDQEVTSEILDGPQSIVFAQAENRLHVQKALLCLLLG